MPVETTAATRVQERGEVVGDVAVWEEEPGAWSEAGRTSAGRAGAVSVTWCKDVALVLLVGDLGATEAEQLRSRLLEVVDGGSRSVVVDASAATWSCGAVLEALEEISTRIGSAGGTLAVVDAPAGLALRLRRSGITARASRIAGHAR